FWGKLVRIQPHLLAWGLCSISLLAEAATGPIIPEPAHPVCEFLLTDKDDAQATMNLVAARLRAARGTSKAYLSYSPTDVALRELGLPVPWQSDFTMTIDSKESDKNLFWIRLNGPGQEIKAYAFHVPPVAIWKKVFRSQNEINLDLTLESEDKNDLEYGT